MLTEAVDDSMASLSEIRGERICFGELSVGLIQRRQSQWDFGRLAKGERSFQRQSLASKLGVVSILFEIKAIALFIYLYEMIQILNAELAEKNLGIKDKFILN